MPQDDASDQVKDSRELLREALRNVGSKAKRTVKRLIHRVTPTKIKGPVGEMLYGKKKAKTSEDDPIRASLSETGSFRQ